MSLGQVLGYDLRACPVSSVMNIVFVVDHDLPVRESLELLMSCEGWQPETFASSEEEARIAA